MVIAVKKVVPVKQQAQQEQVQAPAQAKVKAAPPPDVFEQVKQTDDSIIVKVDLMVDLKDELEAMKPKVKKYDDAKKFLQSVADADGEPDQVVEIVGSNGNKVLYSPKCDQQVITDKNGLLAALKVKFVEAAGGDKTKGYETMLGLVQLPLGEVQKYLTEVEQAKYITKVPASGPRKLQAVMKGTA